jgi:hypothetical protein
MPVPLESSGVVTEVVLLTTLDSPDSPQRVLTGPLVFGESPL